MGLNACPDVLLRGGRGSHSSDFAGSKEWILLTGGARVPSGSCSAGRTIGAASRSVPSTGRAEQRGTALRLPMGCWTRIYKCWNFPVHLFLAIWHFLYWGKELAGGKLGETCRTWAAEKEHEVSVYAGNKAVKVPRSHDRILILTFSI